MIGPAILVFALVSLAVNMSLLAFRFKEESPPTAEASDMPPASPPTIVLPSSSDEDAETGDSPPVPAAHPGRRPARKSPKGEASPARARLSPTVDIPDGVPSPDDVASPSKWLHAAFHPGCDGCDDESCSGSETTGQVPTATSEAKQKEKNLNLYGATLHLATDVVRSFIVLLTGLALKSGIVNDVARTDAVCALLVGVCVLVGSAAFFYAPIVQFFSKQGTNA